MRLEVGGLNILTFSLHPLTSYLYPLSYVSIPNRRTPQGLGVRNGLKSFPLGFVFKARITANGQQRNIIKLIRLADMFLNAVGNAIEQVGGRGCRGV